MPPFGLRTPRHLEPEGDDGSRSARPSPWFLAGYLLLAVWSTWPLARHLTTHVPLGSEPAVTVPLMNVWTVWWNADRLRHGLRGYWDAPIFHPESNAFAFSEAQPTTLLVAPLVWLLETPLTAYNVYLLLSLTLNGWFGARLLAAVYGRLGPALLGGALLEMLPVVHWQLGVLQMVPFWGVLWTLRAVWRFSETPRVRTGISAGVAFGVTYLTCNYHGMFFGLLLVPCAAFLLGRQLLEPQAWLRLLPGAVIAVLLLLPVVVVQLRVSRDLQWASERNLGLVRTLSAEYGDYTASPWPQLLPLGDLAADSRRHVVPLSPGYVKYALAAIGLIGGVWMRKHRRWTAFCLALGGFALLLSMGPKFRIGPLVPYYWLVEVVPGFVAVRSLFRASLFVQIGVASLAAGGLLVVARLAESAVDRILHGQNPSAATRRRGRLGASAAVVVVAGGIGVFEVYPPSPRAFQVPEVPHGEGWISWLRRNTEPTDPIVAVPFTVGGAVQNYQKTSLEMYWSIFHQRPLANGYSGFFPPRFQQLMDTMYHQFPDPPALHALEKRGVRVLVVRRAELTPRRAERLERSSGVERVYSDDTAEVDIYRLK